MSVTVRVEGLAELQRKFRRMDRKQIKELADGPVFGAGKIIEQAARDKAPRLTGELAESMETQRVEDAPDASDFDLRNAAVRVFPRDFVGLFQEYGWNAAGSGRKVRGQPFLRPAFQGSKGKAQQHAVSGIRKAIERRFPEL